MTSTSQAGSTSDLSSHRARQQQQQHQLDGNNAHTLAAVASAAGYTSDNHLAGLVEAATAAAGQDVNWSSQNEDGGDGMAAAAAAVAASGHSRMQNQLDGYGVGMHLDDEFGNPSNGSGGEGGGGGGGGGGSGRTHPQFGSIASGGQNSNGSFGGLAGKGSSSGGGGDGPQTRKRRRMNPNVDPAMTTPVSSQFESGANAGGDNIVEGGNGSRSGDGNNDDDLNIRQLDVRQLTPQQAISDARAAGVHSAVALFRQPSSTSKKHTRPPMSKMFTSLQLSPENFLHLQAAAKGYMLDDNHPERRDCVGQRGKGDMEMVKLRLWNCVKDFLDGEGNGLRFFGEHVVNEGVGARSLIWPRDEQKIISLVMPLLRRMVTNERQRRYAIESRKGGSAEEKKRTHEESSHVTSEQSFQQPQPTPLFNPSMELSMNELLMEGYPNDSESLARSYDAYNQGYQLDNLGSVSGLPESEWCGLVRAVDCHYQVTHDGNPMDCDASCEECIITHIVSSNSVSNAHWPLSGGDENAMARNYFATGITRDISRIIRESLMDQSSPPQQQHQQAGFPPPTDTLLRGSVNDTHQQNQLSPASALPEANPEQTSITLRVNILQPGQNKRVLPRLDLSVDQCADFPTLLDKVRQYYQHHQPQHAVPPLRLRAWLEDGLMTVQNDGEWMVALLAVSTAEWMDGELRIIVDDGGGQHT